MDIWIESLEDSLRTRRKRKGKNRNRGLLAAVLILAAACVWQGCQIRQKEKEEFPALAWITALEQRDTGEIKAALNARDEAERQQEEAERAEQEAASGGQAGEEQTEKGTDKDSLRRRFEQAVLVGDSVAEGFIDYEILDPSRIVAQKGLRADSAGPDIEKALDLSPSCLFLSIGLNDLEYCAGDSGRFVKEYEKRLQEIRDRAPELPIYVNAIMPVLPAAVEKKPVLAHVGDFNAALKELCAKWEITFIDSGDILAGHEEWYQKDSTHLTSEPYTLWLQRMEEAAGI